MPSHRSHDRDVYLEPERHDELSAGVPGDPSEQQQARKERKAGGRGIPPGATAIPRLGGKAHKGKPKLVRGKALTKAGSALHRALCAETASTEGGGVCDRRASLMLRWAADKTEMAERAKAAGDLESFRRLTESARMDLLYAREHAAKAAQARPRAPADPLGRWRLPGDATTTKAPA
ncbi:MAG TPA: hypothetical protein VGG39_28565 [Polyangiaceae bacterium]|jgi:hypothetical protein